jgi:hypothetical protein
MSLPRLRTSPDAPDFDEAAGLSYDQAPNYDEAADPDHEQAPDPDYDESSQGEFADSFIDSDSEDASQ